MPAPGQPRRSKLAFDIPRFLLGLPVVVMLAGCPPHAHGERAGLPPCQKFGDNCEFSPGKLGSCVVRDGCTQGDCFVCQSQH